MNLNYVFLKVKTGIHGKTHVSILIVTKFLGIIYVKMEVSKFDYQSWYPISEGHDMM